MPLPEETLREIKERIDSAKERIKDLEETIADLRASGIDVLGREEEVKRLRDELRKWETFYSLQAKRLGRE